MRNVQSISNLAHTPDIDTIWEPHLVKIISPELYITSIISKWGLCAN